MRIQRLFYVLLLVQLVGCAGTAPKATFIQSPKEDAKLHSNDTATVTVNAQSGVELQEFEKQRLAGAVDQKLSAKKQLNTAGTEAVKYDVELTVTKYEKGNAFARAMLAGLGQIHIDASVRLVKTENKEKVSEFLVSKTFAWGGLYGGITRIEDIEPAFAEGIAAALTGQSENSPSKSN